MAKRKVLILQASENEAVKAFKVRVEAGRPTIIVGYNATLKSAIARSFMYCGKSTRAYELLGPTLQELNIEFTLSDPDLPCNALKGFVPDSRLVFRSVIVGLTERYGKILDNVESIKRLISEDEARRIESELNAIESGLNESLKVMGLKFLDDLEEFKRRASSKAVYEVRRVFDETLDEIVRELRERYEVQISPEAIVPLEIIEMRWHELSPRVKMPEIRVWDKRLKREITVTNVSSSIIASLLHEYLTYFLSIPQTKILVIEEPEEAMTPLQQVFTMKFLAKALQHIDRIFGVETYAIITTHSPYIAYAERDAVNLYFARYEVVEGEKGKIVIDEEKPHSPFLLADFLL